jgi:hypothetical protein
VVRVNTEEAHLWLSPGAVKQPPAVTGADFYMDSSGSRGLDEVFVQALELLAVDEVHAIHRSTARRQAYQNA